MNEPSQEKSPAAAATAGPGIADSKRTKGSATPRKWQRVLKAFADGGNFNRFEAATLLRDWCLNSTVSGVEQRGIVILRKDEQVPGAYGPVRCCRYWLAPQSIEPARAMLVDCQPSQSSQIHDV